MVKAAKTKTAELAKEFANRQKCTQLEASFFFKTTKAQRMKEALAEQAHNPPFSCHLLGAKFMFQRFSALAYSATEANM